MPRIRYTAEDVDLIARMMRAEAVAEGQVGMLMVGNVIVNRAISYCLDFSNVNTIRDVIFQIQGANFSFEAVQKGELFWFGAREIERNLARMALDFWTMHPSKFSLWYFNPFGPCPETWYGQPFTGQYGAHCFYEPVANTCPSVYLGR